MPTTLPPTAPQGPDFPPGIPPTRPEVPPPMPTPERGPPDPIDVPSPDPDTIDDPGVGVPIGIPGDPGGDVVPATPGLSVL